MVTGVTGIAVGIQKITIARAIQHIVTILTTNPNFPRENGAFLTTARFRSKRIRTGRP